MSNWISVKVQKPKDGQEVLGYFINEMSEGYHEVVCYQAQWYYQNEEWVDHSGKKHLRVKAWMPLPKETE